jgi:hypothetical protein
VIPLRVELLGMKIPQERPLQNQDEQCGLEPLGLATPLVALSPPCFQPECRKSANKCRQCAKEEISQRPLRYVGTRLNDQANLRGC